VAHGPPNSNARAPGKYTNLHGGINLYEKAHKFLEKEINIDRYM
jgi:hypothetical protein